MEDEFHSLRALPWKHTPNREIPIAKTPKSRRVRGNIQAVGMDIIAGYAEKKLREYIS